MKETLCSKIVSVLLEHEHEMHIKSLIQEVWTLCIGDDSSGVDRKKSIWSEIDFLTAIGHLVVRGDYEEGHIAVYGDIHDAKLHVPGTYIVFHNPDQFTGTGMIVSNTGSEIVVVWDERCKGRLKTYPVINLNHQVIFYAPNIGR